MARQILRLRFYWLAVVLMVCSMQSFAQNGDSTNRKTSDTLRYPLRDRRGDRFTYRNNNPFYLSDSGVVKQDVQYDPKTKEYYIIEKIGNTYCLTILR